MRALMVFTAVSVLAVASPVFAGSPAPFVENTYEEWIKGEAARVTIDADGWLSLGPRLSTTGSFAFPIIDAVAQDSLGNLFIASASQVYRRTPAGMNESIMSFSPDKVTALVIGPDGTLYAAVSPGGSIYRCGPKGELVRVADTGQKYIWTMRFEPTGSLLVGTGNQGILQRIVFTGTTATVSNVFDSDEENITSIELLGTTVFAGTAPHGRVYRIERGRHPFLALDTKAQEASGILAEQDGTIWVTTLTAPAAQPAGSPAPSAGSMTIQLGGGSPGLADKPAAPITPPPLPSPTTEKGACLYRIAPDGMTEVYWQSPESVLFGLAKAADGTLYIGSGSRGRLFALRGRNRAALVAQVPSKQIVWLGSTAHNGVSFVCTEPASAYTVSSGVAPSGTFTSAVLTANDQARWGRIALEPEKIEGVRILTRAGNTETPDATWTAWAPLNKLGKIGSPTARSLQYSIQFSRVEGGAQPLRSLTIYYALPNRPPVIDKIAVGPPHTKLVLQPGAQTSASGGSSIPALLQEWAPGPAKAGSTPVADAMALAVGQQVSRTAAHGFRSAVWSALDPNNDRLTFSAWLANQDEPDAWFIIAKDRQAPFVSFDSTEWADGRYRLKIEATDTPDNALSSAQSTERTSESFLIDNTPPEVTITKAARSPHGVRIEFTVSDDLSVISKVQVCIDDGEPVPVMPVDGVLDAEDESFAVELKAPADATTVRVSAMDEGKNTAGAAASLAK